MSNQKKKKVYPKFFKRDKGAVIYPEIRLQGKWLLKLGFQVGSYIELRCEEKKITITLFENSGHGRGNG